MIVRQIRDWSQDLLCSPDGRYIVVPGKLAPIVTVFSVAKMLAAIESRNFKGNEDGIPVLNPDAVKVVEIPVGPGSLHTRFDDKGFAYTSLYEDGVIVKWKLGSWEIVDELPVAYNIGHLAIAGSNTRHPAGDYLVALNKTTKPRVLDSISALGRRSKISAAHQH